jgi:hypothetical protein
MFVQTWKKYLPVINLLMKRSAGGDQVLSMNHTDFERAAGGKKIKFTFSGLRLDNGRLNFHVKHTALAKDLAQLLQENEQSTKLTRGRLFEFSMNSDFQLIIKNNTPVPEIIAEETSAPAQPVDAAEGAEKTGDA